MVKKAFAAALLLAFTSCTSGPGWTPADCKQDMELAALIADRIQSVIEESGESAVTQVDWDRYSAVGLLLSKAGCNYVPEEWDGTE